jgi:hypothetical protein
LHKVVLGTYRLIAVQGTKTKRSKTRLVGRGDGLLIGLAPEAFEAWVGERFRELGYDVQVTQFQGDHGVDLVLTRRGEKVVVQCKHHPMSTIGEPVLRDLHGAMHHLGADAGFLVTTGQISKAAREWAVGKPLQFWDAQRLKTEWGTALALVANEVARNVVPEGSPEKPARGSMGWYVYTDDQNNRWAVELPRSIGGQVALGFEPLTDPAIRRLPRTLRMRHMNLKSDEPNPRYLKRIPYGQPRLPSNAWTDGLVFTSSSGKQTIWRMTGEFTERQDRGVQPVYPNGFRPSRWITST